MPNPLNVMWLPQTSGLCGAACVQMILNAKGKANPDLATLNALWNDIKTNTIQPGPNPAGSPVGPCGQFVKQICESCQPPFCWCTYPSALAATINMHLGGGAASVSIDPSEDAITARAIASIDNDLAASVLVHHGTHWVVVFGYKPTVLGPGQTATHLMIRDPEHQNAQTLVDMTKWTSSYLTQIRCGTLKQRSVVVGAGGAARRRGKAHEARIVQTVVPSVSDLAAILDPSLIETRARKAAAWLLTQEWVAALRDATPQPPQLVADFENAGRAYYLVEFLTGARSTARMVFDARAQTGAEYAGIDKPDEQLPRFLPPDEVLRTAAYRDSAGLVIDGGAAGARSTLVWKACDQSHTPFLPFYQIQQDRGVAYLRADGVLFTELTTTGAGA